MGEDTGNKNSNESGSSTATKKCGLTELVIFVAALVCGTACSISSKTMMQMHSTGISGKEEIFAKPLFQTFGMFVGMLLALVMHWAVIFFRIDFPGYDHAPAAQPSVPPSPRTPLPVRLTGYGSIQTEKDLLLPKKRNARNLIIRNKLSDVSSTPNNYYTPWWMYFFLAIPSIFDLGATALCMMGLRYLDVSIYQLLRGSGIIFVALMKQHVLGDKLYKFQWLGVFWNVVSVCLVGATAILDAKSSTSRAETEGEAIAGVLFVVAGALVQAMQFVFEEHVMTDQDLAVPPLLLVGVEGLWGTIMCLAVLYPVAYYIPGHDHGSYEDPFNTWVMLVNSGTIQWAFVVYFVAVFGYNLFAVLVTFLLNSVWHAILDNFRPVTVWLTDLIIFYVITAGTFGEPWTKFSWIQLTGMVVLLYGTSVYNVPNAGSIRLTGEWWNLGIDLTYEYEELELSVHAAAAHPPGIPEREDLLRTRSSLSEHSPYMSVHTQSLRGFASFHL